MRYLVLGATGMLGAQFFKTALHRNLDVYGAARSVKLLESVFDSNKDRLRALEDVSDIANVEKVLDEVQPQVVVNCIGIVKQSDLATDYIQSISINSLFPHLLNKACEDRGIQMVHISTDCVFDGSKGRYMEEDLPNATDLYGKSKHMGEVDYGNTVTIRTSIIGHEWNKSTHGLVEWFLAQEGEVKGFTNAFFSGFTTLELTKLILDYVLPKKLTSGLYQASSERISKYDLLEIINDQYGHGLNIVPDSDFEIDRSLDSSHFRSLVEYEMKPWSQQIEEMKKDKDYKV